jgi:hypothetical protein
MSCVLLLGITSLSDIGTTGHTLWMHQWFTFLSLLFWVSSQSLSMWPQQTDRSWSCNPKLKQDTLAAASLPSTVRTPFKRWVNNCSMSWVRSGNYKPWTA